MERFWNIIHYFTYRADCRLTFYFYKYIGAFKLYNLPVLKKRFKRKWDIEDPIGYLLNLNNRSDIGLSSIFAGILMGSLPMIFFFGLHCFYIAFIEKPKSFEQMLTVFIIYSGISCLISYIFLFRHDKYMRYFKEFDKMSHKWKIKWAWISLGVILFPFIILALSFMAMSEGSVSN